MSFLSRAASSNSPRASSSDNSALLREMNLSRLRNPVLNVDGGASGYGVEVNFEDLRDRCYFVELSSSGAAFELCVGVAGDVDADLLECSSDVSSCRMSLRSRARLAADLSFSDASMPSSVARHADIRKNLFSIVAPGSGRELTHIAPPEHAQIRK